MNAIGESHRRLVAAAASEAGGGLRAEWAGGLPLGESRVRIRALLLPAHHARLRLLVHPEQTQKDQVLGDVVCKCGDSAGDEEAVLSEGGWLVSSGDDGTVECPGKRGARHALRKHALRQFLQRRGQHFFFRKNDFRLIEILKHSPLGVGSYAGPRWSLVSLFSSGSSSSSLSLWNQLYYKNFENTDS
eukprot:CAMPEP_0178983980 /NCGR_PEP_ID=MMETSP0795-20121207/1355_1 /TAXON_ID=88552 /ORGANISM="Amoebophrya sp., Strain Ameob2" /LENGTH=187 /DNA_ID=CAMNT_0020674801 /DNA_START=343 /DNA_END=903 /DNA_ORIENTATION=-